MRKVRDILYDNGFKFNHRLGQNFITDVNLLNKIVDVAGVGAEDVVLEIGAGAGTLTRALAEKCKKVYSFEVDEKLKPVLDETLSGLENVEVLFKDVLKLSDAEIFNISGDGFKIVANIPYYITTPLIMRFLESGLKPKSVTVMVQKEVADRLVAAENTPDYGAITLAVKLYGDAKVVGNVGKEMFYPSPKVDSSIVRIDLTDRYEGINKALVSRLIKSAFAMRRKTFVNNLTASFALSREQAEKLLTDCGLDVRVRGEVLPLEQFIKLSENEIFTK